MGFRRGNLSPIKSIKHIIDVQGAVTAGVQDAITIAQAKDNPVLANRDEVEKGCRINSIFLNVEVRGTSTTTLANAYMFLFKNPAGNIPAVPLGNAIGIADEKRQVFHQEMKMMSDVGDSIPVTLFKGVLKIPKVFHTMRANDLISLFVFSPSGMQYCVQCIYKEYN